MSAEDYFDFSDAFDQIDNEYGIDDGWYRIERRAMKRLLRDKKTKPFPAFSKFKPRKGKLFQ